MSKKSALHAAPTPQPEPLLDHGQTVVVRRETSFSQVADRLACLTHLVKCTAFGRYDLIQPRGEEGEDIALGLANLLEDIHRDLYDLNRLLGGQATDAVVGSKQLLDGAR